MPPWASFTDGRKKPGITPGQQGEIVTTVRGEMFKQCFIHDHYIKLESKVMETAVRLIHGMAREIARRVDFLKHQCPYPCQPARRVALRMFSELVLGSIHGLIAGKLKDGISLYECSQDEKILIKELRKCRAEIHSMLASVGCDIADVEN
ncbi:hypothetical protein ACOSTF_004685 [Escherichia coli]